MTFKVCMQHQVLEYYQFCSNDDPGLTSTYFTARSNLVPCAFIWEKVRTMEFSETIVICDVKVGRCSQLNEYMKVWVWKVKVIDWPWSKSLRCNIFFSSITIRPIEAKIHVEPPWDGGRKAYSNGPGHLTKMAAMPIYGKNHWWYFSVEPKGRWPWNLVYSIEYSSTTKFSQMLPLGWPEPILWQGQIWSPMLLY